MAAKEGSYCNNNKKFIKRVRATKYYGRCSEKGHNSCTCTVEIKDIGNSDTSEE